MSVGFQAEDPEKWDVAGLHRCGLDARNPTNVIQQPRESADVRLAAHVGHEHLPIVQTDVDAHEPRKTCDEEPGTDREHDG
jgi:hypothetical protein